MRRNMRGGGGFLRKRGEGNTKPLLFKKIIRIS
jgi:hypothetical protein